MPNAKVNFTRFESEFKEKFKGIWNVKNPSQSNNTENTFPEFKSEITKLFSSGQIQLGDTDLDLILQKLYENNDKNITEIFENINTTPKKIKRFMIKLQSNEKLKLIWKSNMLIFDNIKRILEKYIRFTGNSDEIYAIISELYVNADDGMQLIQSKCANEDFNKIKSELYNDAEIKSKVFHESSTEVENTDKGESTTEILGKVIEQVADEEEENNVYLDNLSKDLAIVPSCAEHTTMKLLLHYEHKSLERERDTYDKSVVDSLLKQLPDQITKEELITGQVTNYLKDLNRSVKDEDFSSVVACLKKLLKCIRPLDVCEIKRLIQMTNKSTDMIAGKDIVLLIGSTGAGKSTTIHFLAGSKMELVKEKTGEGTFLDHIKPVEIAKIKDLRVVNTSPKSKSETRYIWSVTIPLNDIACHLTGDIILCDAPGFADTSGPEIDIANTVGVISALSGCKSVKILALQSYQDLGNKGEGIQKLAHILSKMIDDVQSRLDSIFYAFTKFPAEKNDIHDLLKNIRKERTEKDSFVSSDISFEAVLNDMIRKTESVPCKIDPINGSREKLVEGLIRLSHIRYPGDVFRFTMIPETHAAINSYAQQSQLSIIRAMKYNNIDLVAYYLNNLKDLNDWLKESVIQETYEKSIQFISENIEQCCEETTKKFNRALQSQEGLRQEDIREYKHTIEYIEKLGKSFDAHLKSCVPKPERLMNNIELQLQEKRAILEKMELHNRLVGVYLENLRMLKEVFRELESIYSTDCKYRDDQFKKIITSIKENIENNEIDKVTENMLVLSKSACVLKPHLGKQLEDKYHSIIELFLQRLYSYVTKSEPLLQKIRLNDDDIQKLKSYLDILRSAKESVILQECLSTYMETLKTGPMTSNQRSKSLNEIYNEFIEKVIKHFDEINIRIKDLFEKGGDCALESIEKFLQDMHNIREIPEIEVKTSASYYRTVENIRGYMQQLQKDAEQFIVDIEKRAGNINYGHLAKSLSRIKEAEWINRATPGAYDKLLTRVKEDLTDSARSFEEQLVTLEFHLKHPENVNVAYAIVQKIGAMRILEGNIPELKNYREKVENIFRETIQSALDSIQTQFNLQDKDVYNLKQQLKQLEKIENEYENLHPARKYLVEQGYQNIDQLNDKINDINEKIKEEIANEKTMQVEKEEKAKKFQDIIGRYSNTVAASSSSEKVVDREDILKEHGFSTINDVYRATVDSNTDYDKKLQQVIKTRAEVSKELNDMNEIGKRYKSLLLDRSDSFCLEGVRYLQENNKKSIELLQEEILEKKSTISKQETNKQKYDFSSRLDGSVANLALCYTNQCEKVQDLPIKQTATETSQLLHKYLTEYMLFSEQEMSRLYQNGRNSEIEGGSFQYCYELCMRLEELAFIEKFPEVSKCLKATESLTKWKQEIMSYFTSSSDQMENLQKRDERELLGKQLSVIKGFVVLDRLFGNTQFYELHKRFQSDVIDDLTDAYKRTLRYIQDSDYISASNVLSDINDKPLNMKAKKQIELELQSSLTKLMKETKRSAQWLYGKIEREEENAQKFSEIVANLEKISIVETKLNLKELLDEKSRNDVKHFSAEIDKILSEMILQVLNSIEMYMNAENFAQAEEGLKKINSVVEHHLKSIINDERVISKSQNLRNKLNELIKNIGTTIDFSDIDKYFEKPPKDLLDNLRLLSQNNDQYKQIYKALLGKLRKDLKDILEKIGKLPMKQRSTKLRALTHALIYIPEDLQNEFKVEINEMTESNRSAQKDFEDVLSKTLKGEQETEQTFRNLSQLAKNFEDQGMDELTEHMSTDVLKKLEKYQIEMQSALETSDIQLALQHMHKMIKYKDSVAQYIPGIKEVHDKSRKLTLRNFENCSKALAEIGKIEKPETVENAFKSVISCVRFSNRTETSEENFLPKTVLQKCENDLKTMRDYLQSNSEKYRHALDSMIVDDLHSALVTCKKWQNLLQQVKDCAREDESTKRIIPDIENVVTHSNMLTTVAEKINHLKDKLNVELISDETARYQQKRKAFFQDLKKSLEKLKEIDEKLSDVLPTPINSKESVKHLKTKVKEMDDALREVSCKHQMNEQECNKFRKYYEHLQDIDEYLTLPDVKVKENLDESKTKVLEKVTSLHNELVATNKEDKVDYDKASEIVVEMKSLAENLVMFDTAINAKIDCSLKSFKNKYGSAQLSKLTMKLQNSDIGMRIMSEHSILKAEDWRCRNIKTQGQNNIDYVLNALEGDDLDKQMLKSRYEDFNTMYQEILRRDVGSSDEKLCIKTLATNARSLVDSLLRNSPSKSMSKAFQDRIPELLANIFGIWTLQSTEYYNEMRGIDSRDTYLLCPHVAQIIAILRILGIGYKTMPKGKNLINNLVQIGTGEGKSVVLAAVSCVFALAGIDVSCSCYSSDLSTRDKEAFASLFQILGVSEKIDYGTFNKLCENLLNEQCNVREKVCDMILNNQNVLKAVEQKKCKPEKVLLIDEVDVFLSDEYYGGSYAPIFLLKHPKIKALLDSIWNNKGIRTLNGIKALPAYIACAQAFSNWTFLFDEAIKDLIAALQSYQSSTYAVRNNKIVYIEGESLVENVVRGYDTVWAYYHENSQRKISSDSLEQNVGIIVNCGVFSFAEMPHDFWYITGVTGTLKTLADAEKAILQTVYKVEKKTYMPSQFGSSNRLYNCETDVRVVSESEYFTSILDEIDTMRKAKRAILVFFESAEKLDIFHKSSEKLSNDPEVQVINEIVAIKDRQLLIKRAATVEKVTLLTRTFGRGTDFICNNQQLLANGGLHVLQTFFSKELSEEYQLMGRGARQGDRGSYKMILLDKDLDWVLGSCWETRLKEINGRTLYENLNISRNKIFQSNCNSKGIGIEQRKKEHDASKSFMNAVNSGDIVAVKTFLKSENQGANIALELSRTILLMDATGSMASLLSAVKETICTMFKGAVSILNENKLPSDAFQMQFTVYRDYDCRKEVLQSSSWESKPNNLKNFLAPISATGGGDYEEAIEIGLWHAVQQSKEPEGLAQVILIGDAPAKEKPAIQRDRNANGGEAYWNTTNYKTPTYYVDELMKLKEKKIPVHAFYMNSGAQSNFQKIATLTGGRCELLDIYRSEGAEMLTKYVTEEILRKAAGEKGNEVVEQYRKKLAKGYLS